MKRLVPAAIAALLALPLLVSTAATPGVTEAVQKGAAFIRSTQQPDGGFGGFGPGQTMDAIFALRSAGIDPNTVEKDGKSPADFLAANAEGATSAGAAAKAALAARALNLNPRDVSGVDFVATVTAAYQGGKYAEDDFTQSIAILGLACTGNDIPAGAVLRLRDTQLEDGGWGFDGSSDPDTSAIAAQALLAAGVPNDDPAILEAIAYFQDEQGDDGGWGFDPSESNTSSTAFVIQALIAAGEDSESATYAKDGKTGIDYLLSKQRPDGSFEGFDPAYAANQVVPALAGRTFCNAPMTAIQPAQPTVTATTTSTATSTATATATATRTAKSATKTATPRAPRTGTGSASGGGPSLVLFATVLTVALATAGAVAVTAGRRRR